MFDLNLFIVTNLVKGVKNGTFTKEYANITAVNYLSKGMLTEDDVISVNAQVEAWEAENEAQNAENNVVSDLNEENTDYSEDGAISSEYEATEGTESDSLIENTEESEELIDAEEEGEPLA